MGTRISEAVAPGGLHDSKQPIKDFDGRNLVGEILQDHLF